MLNQKIISMKNSRVYKAYALHNVEQLPQWNKLNNEAREAIKVVGQVLPFKTNNYVIEQLINWDDPLNDPMFRLTFPQRGMLNPTHYEMMKTTLDRTSDTGIIKSVANKIRLALNPHPAGQMEHNVPELNGEKLNGLQHKYKETVLFFPSNGQTCHAYCTFCFRWPQFTGMNEFKFAQKDAQVLVDYLEQHPEVTDVLFTGGDPMIMKAKILDLYIRPLLSKNMKHIRSIRIGTKALGYWPYRFTTDDDAQDVLRLFKDVTEAGKHLAFMAHFSHPVELSTPAVQEAIQNIRLTGAQLRTQSPILRGINDHSAIWKEMWNEQVAQGLIPYYMFIPRDTGAQDYFAVPLARAYRIFRNAYSGVSGLARTVRGPSMSATPGKVAVQGVTEIDGQRYFVLTYLQARDPKLTMKPFLAPYSEDAIWLNDLEIMNEEMAEYTNAFSH